MITGAPVVSRVGYYRVIRSSFVLKIFTGLSLLLIGQDHPWMIAAFFVIERYMVAVFASVCLFVSSFVSSSSRVVTKFKRGQQHSMDELL